jgi:ribosomal protein S18 acetylase RimI-like enzyme
LADGDAQGIPPSAISISDGALCPRKPWQIVDIALVPASRRRGLGRALLSAVLAAATAAGATVSLSVEVGNPASGLYERLDFVPTGLADHYREMEWRPASPDEPVTPQLKTA